jgi:hypothetical protein
MSAEQISLKDFASCFSWQTFHNLPDDRAAVGVRLRRRECSSESLSRTI